MVQGTVGIDAFTYTPNAAVDADGVVDINGELVTFTGAENLTLAGLGGADSLNANPPSLAAVDDVLSVTPAAGDDGSFRYNASTPVTFTSLEARTFALGLSVLGDQITVQATNNNDDVAVVAGVGTVAVTLNAELFTFNFDAADADRVTVNLGDGDDAATVTPSADIAVTIHGGDPSASDSLTIVNGATTATVTETTATVTGTEPTSFTGIESLIVNGTGALTLQGGAFRRPDRGQPDHSHRAHQRRATRQLPQHHGRDRRRTSQRQ